MFDAAEENDSRKMSSIWYSSSCLLSAGWVEEGVSEKERAALPRPRYQRKLGTPSIAPSGKGGRRRVPPPWITSSLPNYFFAILQILYSFQKKTGELRSRFKGMKSLMVYIIRMLSLSIKRLEGSSDCVNIMRDVFES